MPTGEAAPPRVGATPEYASAASNLAAEGREVKVSPERYDPQSRVGEAVCVSGKK